MGLLSKIIAAGNAAARKYASSKSSSSSSSSSNKSSGSKSTSSGGSSSNPITTYNVTTGRGADIAANLPAGQGFMNSDNHYWEKDANSGKIYVTSPSGNRLTLTINDSVYTDPSFRNYEDDSANAYYEKYLSGQQSVIEEQARAQEEAIRRQTQATIDSINANIPKINQDYEAQQRANYISNERAKAGMGDYLSAAGYSGGMAESTALGLQSNYENLRNTTDQEKNNALAELQNMVAQAQATGDTNLANIASQKYQSMLSAMQSARQSADSMAQWQQDMAMRQRQYADSQAQQAWENQFAEKGLAWEQEQAAIANALAKAKEARISSGSTSAKRTASPAAYSENDIFNTPAATQSAPLANTAYQNSLLTRGLLANGSTASVAANNIIAAIQNGEITEAEGRKRLLALGIQI